jgi:hypothetical protein
MNNPSNSGCTENILSSLHTLLANHSPYALAFQQMGSIERDQGSDTQTVTMTFKRGPDQRRYNEPKFDEVAAIFVGQDGAPPTPDLFVHPNNQAPRRISYMSPNCDPMLYPMLFPRGDMGWFPGMDHTEEHRSQKRTRVTLLQYYSYRLACRTQFSPIHHAGKLFQQYIVDAYVKTEASR